MRRNSFLMIALLLPLLAATGCWFIFSVSFDSEEDGVAAAAERWIDGDPGTDGHVLSDGTVSTRTVILAGAGPALPEPPPEARGFLSFPIGAIPPGALVEAASVTFFVDRLDLLPGSPDALLDVDHVRYGPVLTASAFGLAGTPVRSVAAGIGILPTAVPQPVPFDATPELQEDVNDPSLLFFQLRIFAAGGLARIVDGAGNRAGGLPPDLSLAPVLYVRYFP